MKIDSPALLPQPLRQSHWHLLWAGIILMLFVLILFYRLLFTNRVLASGDIFLYFYPYRDYAAAALRSGHLPLWNPYIFLGVPFLANPQAAVLYPLHWPLSWLPVTQQIYWSAAMHTWLLGFGAYLLLRRWQLSGWASLIGGLVAAGSGFYGGLIGHINQMNGAAWLPYGFWILEWQTSDFRQAKIQNLKSIALFGLVVALMLLAGHTQTAYINLFGLGVWSIWPRCRTASWQQIVATTLPRLLNFVLGVLLGVLISAAQLLPTLELSALGLRNRGLGYQEVTALGLKPLHLLWTLLPSYGLVNLQATFATPAYSELIGYVGLIGLLLALIGVWRSDNSTLNTARTFGLLFAILGLLLALGRWNPLYYVLYKLAPGFNLFRTPARWLMLYTLGMAVLAALGAERLLGEKRQGDKVIRWAGMSPCHLVTLSSSLLLLFVAMDLLLAALSLPHTQPTAPQAVSDVRTAPAHLLTDPARLARSAGVDPAASGRFLGMSTITYDPGDLADWRRLLLENQLPQLDQPAFNQFIIALKLQELLVPNLSLLWRIPAVDGFDGGVLPLQRYNQFLGLFVPPAELVPDGRLREQIKRVPATNLLNLLNVQYLITDKVRDLWFQNVFYDRQIGATLTPTRSVITLEVPLAFAATHLGVIGYVHGATANLSNQQQTVANITVQDAAGASTTLALTAGGAPGTQLADGLLDSPMAIHSGATVAYRDVDGQQQEYLAWLPLPNPMQPLTVTIARQQSAGLTTPLDVVIQAVTVVDELTGKFTPLLPSDRGRFRLVHSGDVKIYENVDLTPRAHLAYQVTRVADPTEALAALRNPNFVATQAAVVEGLTSFHSQPDAMDKVEMLAYAPERVVLQTRNAARALLVLSDTLFPGWVATVDGQPTPIYPTNVLLRGVMLPPGQHTVIFDYAPLSWQRGLWISAFGLLLCAGLLVVGRVPKPVGKKNLYTDFQD